MRSMYSNWKVVNTMYRDCVSCQYRRFRPAEVPRCDKESNSSGDCTYDNCPIRIDENAEIRDE